MHKRILLPSWWKVCAALLSLVVPAVGPAHGQTGSSSSVGYIDSALPVTQFRLRYDGSYDSNRPSRADFIYSKNAPGPANDNRVNFEEINAYLEMAATCGLSAFIEMPYRFLQPDVNPHTRGFGDLNFGFKYALLNEEDTVLTAQLRVITPTANGLEGLGTHNWNAEPAVLYYQRLPEGFTLESELRVFIPVVAYDGFAGNVVRYGTGLSYLAYDCSLVRITPVVEVVSWIALNGKEETPTGEEKSAAGDTIINAKIGVRFAMGDDCEAGLLGASELYVGYGRALTGDVWYKNTFRVEYRLRF
jgi:hypothetical protein